MNSSGAVPVAAGRVIEAIEKAVSRPEDKPSATNEGNTHPTQKMKCVEWHGTHKVKVTERPRPVVTDPADVIVRVTSTCICGSDLHMYSGWFPGMKAGDVLGHEFMGIVEEVGPEVKNFKAGDRVVVSCIIACGHCRFCNEGLTPACTESNKSKVQETVYGASTGSFYGYSHLAGGWQGGQADYARVPYGDHMLLKVPDDLPDEKVVPLADAVPTAWHGNELAEVHDGDTVAIWGCGPVGIMAAQIAFHRGAKRVFIIDNIQYRLDYAKSKIPGLETINFQKQNVGETLREQLGVDGLDVGIEAAGYHYAHSLVHKIEMNLKMETDTSEILNEIMWCVRKNGRIGVIGMYMGFMNHFNFGAFLTKGLSMKAGAVLVQKYWPKLLEKVQTGQLDPSIVFTHIGNLDDAPQLFKVFDSKIDGCVKTMMKPGGKPLASSVPA